MLWYRTSPHKIPSHSETQERPKRVLSVLVWYGIWFRNNGPWWILVPIRPMELPIPSNHRNAANWVRTDGYLT